MVFSPPKKSIYHPINESKYRGTYPIVCRSGWEAEFCAYCDRHPSITSWSSESLIINYFYDIDRKNHRYYPDFVIVLNGDTLIIEIKPAYQCKPPKEKKSSGKPNLYYIEDLKVYIKNQQKWKAAEKFAASNNAAFHVFTEHHLRRLGIKI